MVMSQDEINTAVIGSLRMGDSLYGINSSEFRRAKPTVVLTQALCDVCAPSSRQVAGARELIDEEMVVVNLEPHSLRDVADTFATVSEAVTGSTKTGDTLASEFHAGLGRIASAVSQPERKLPAALGVFCWSGPTPSSTEATGFQKCWWLRAAKRDGKVLATSRKRSSLLY